VELAVEAAVVVGERVEREVADQRLQAAGNAAVLADEGVRLSGVKLERRIDHRLDGAEGLADMGSREQRTRRIARARNAIPRCLLL